MTNTTMVHAGPQTNTALPEITTKAAPKAETHITVIAIAVLILPALGYLVAGVSKMIMVNSADPLSRAVIAQMISINTSDFVINPYRVSQLFFTLILVFLHPLLVMMLFQIGKRFRNPRSRWRIFLNAGLSFLILHFLALTQEAISVIQLSAIYAGAT